MKKIAFFLIVVSLFVSWCSTKTQKADYSQVENSVVVKTWEVSISTKYVWTVSSDKQTFLWFKLPGRIKAIYVQEWDFVKAGELLAVLDWSEVKTQYSSAKQMLDALWTVYKSTEQMFDAQINAMKYKVEQAKTAMKWFKTWLFDTKKITQEQLKTAEKQVKQAEIGLQTAETNLNHTKQILSQKEKDIYNNSKNALSQFDILMKNFLIFVDKIIWASDENRNENNAFEQYLWAKNTSLREKLKNDWIKIDSKYKKFKPQIDSILNDIDINNLTEQDKQKIYNSLKEAYDILVSARKLGKDFYQLLDDTVAWSTLPLQTLNQWKQQTVQFQNQIEAVILSVQWEYVLWVKWSIQAIENFQKESKAKLDLLQKQYDLAKTQYETAKQTYNQYLAMSQWKVNEVSTKYEVAKKQYEEALKWLQALEKQKQAQLSQIMSQIQQVKWNKNLAAVNLWNINLYAPYDGVVLEKMADIGQVVGAWTPIFKFASPSDIKFVFYVPSEKLESYKIWDNIKIKVYDKVLTGYITKIDSEIDPFSKKVKIEAKLNNSVKDINFKLNMYVDIYPLDNTLKWLIIPYDKIKYKYWKPYVFVRNWTGYIMKYIDVKKCDDFNCLVEGLKVWDIVR